MTRIVVGIDGSPESRQALAWAIDEARRRGSELVVAHAYVAVSEEYVPAVGYPFLPEEVARRLLAQQRSWEAQVRERARSHAEAFIDRAVTQVAPDGPGVPWRSLTVNEQRPARALVAAARSAELLVVGSRGLGAVRGRVMGSVSQHCVRHARCPVVVVTGDARVQPQQTAAA